MIFLSSMIFSLNLTVIISTSVEYQIVFVASPTLSFFIYLKISLFFSLLWYHHRYKGIYFSSFLTFSYYPLPLNISFPLEKISFILLFHHSNTFFLSNFKINNLTTEPLNSVCKSFIQDFLHLFNHWSNFIQNFQLNLHFLNWYCLINLFPL